jgi:hypothetical protein
LACKEEGCTEDLQNFERAKLTTNHRILKTRDSENPDMSKNFTEKVSPAETA